MSLSRFFMFLCFFTLFLCPFSASANAPTPVGDIYVQDFAKLLTTEEAEELKQMGRSLQQKTKAQIAVLTVSSTDGMAIEEYGIEAFRQYKLGDRELNNGVLLLVVKGSEQREVRIEVGYGLEGAIPDSKAGAILDEFTLPYFKQGKYGKGIVETYRVLYAETAKEYGVETKWEGKTAIPAEKEASSGQEMNPFVAIIIGIILIILIVIDVKFFGGFLTNLLLQLLFLFRGGGGGGNIGGGGGSAGGGGASRKW
ncbi:TPM domain-containing protein [Priestia endophytica]|jgi:uncharacterized protein|uniref:TPM domain-containing protein n=1 Tax=Priestia endophytica TaxID=135735 RepID=A0AAX1Q237_9BACI|nr:TPM domain-containing protein [Priestia endophytica]RAS71863.1 hypothetical protein A3864_22535 [Priestia endophytica]RAS91988.1 hypothetical protein A3863_04270 [Priestia endophytica]